MISVIRSSLAICLVSSGLVAISDTPSFAQATSSIDLPAERCISFRNSGADGFRLINDCNYPVRLKSCLQADGSSNLCVDPARWLESVLDAGAETTTAYLPLQTINIFACRTSAQIIIDSNGQGHCEYDPSGMGSLPLLLASSLKNAASIITPSDYPRGIKAEGTTRFEMAVAADGRPQSCVVARSSGKEALDKATCDAFMKRARFTPAKDANGVAIAGRYRGNVTWKEQ